MPNPPFVVGTPDFIVDITKLRARDKKGQTQLEYEITTTNIGDGNAFGDIGGIIGGSVYLSDNNVLDISVDVKIKSFFINTAGGLLVGATDKQKFKATLDGSLTGTCLFVLVDPSSVVIEFDEMNNIAVKQIQ